ncbi:MAG: triose-phosphate isomerase [Alphaproteobacteria bacterium]|nr:triose-phosphate isomerase [Alphaproteobacteria bacterium]
MTRRKLIAGNWKMNGLKADGIALATAVAEKYKALEDKKFDMFIAPPFTILDAVADAAKNSGVWVGAQDCSQFEKGAHTGDVSPLMLKDLGCGGVIVGHSERRADHFETNELVNAKATAALAADLGVIICVGETLAEREAGKTLDVVGAQVRGSVPLNATAGKVVIAYEPVWAIGTGKIPTTAEVEEVHAFIRSELAKLLGQDIADKMQILYGGSVKPSNAAELLSLSDVDGALVGGASLKADDFWAIAETVK